LIIREFVEDYKDGVIDLILPIQVQEFSIPITIDQQPDLQQIQEVYQKGNGNFWIAIHDDVIVGTIALIDIGNQQVALRKMFVMENYRGKEWNIAQQLLKVVFAWCADKNVTDIFLGTIDAFKAAQRFYERNNFEKIEVEDLPANFPRMGVDNIFYHFQFK
jgi:N-acetylglutamate synthase-like GNAT family acetyltransferase